LLSNENPNGVIVLRFWGTTRHYHLREAINRRHMDIERSCDIADRFAAGQGLPLSAQIF
jgi:hypothetical protein